MTARTLVSDYEGAWSDWAADTSYWAGVVSELNLLLVYEVPTPCRRIRTRLLHRSKWRPTTTAVGGVRTAVGVRLEVRGFRLVMGNKMSRSQRTTGAHHTSHSHSVYSSYSALPTWTIMDLARARRRSVAQGLALALCNGYRINNRLNVERQSLLGGIDVRVRWDRGNPRVPQFSINTRLVK